MQNWDALQPSANYDQHNNWYNTMFAANIKTEPGTTSPTPAAFTSSHLEQYFKQQQQQQQQGTSIDTMSAMTPSPSNNDSMQNFIDNNLQQQQLYQQQFQQAQQAAAQNQNNTANLPLGFNPLTPPGLPTAVLPSMSHFYNNNNNSNNMRNGGHIQTPSPQPMGLHALHVDGSSAEVKLQAALTPRNTPPMDVTPPKSPKQPETTIQQQQQLQQQQQQQTLSNQNNDVAMEKEQDLMSNSSEDMKYACESEDDESIRMPIYNSHGKMKNYRCKSCSMVSITKVAFWEHARSHMKPEKILQCPKCPFVTELKHHLEYHIRKHKNLKPFQCDKCSYTCVNKSMLNSHRKSHSSVYQYRCADCDYATKYCHSFKLHLRKYEHKPGLVLDEEGLPNPSVVIDVYGTRRGPKNKSVVAAGPSVGNNKRHSSHDIKMPVSQLSAALQGFPHQLPTSPAKSTTSSVCEMPIVPQPKTQTKKTTANPGSQATAISNLLPPLASILQQNRNMAFFPYWNLNLQMLAAQQQAVFAQLSPGMNENALKHLQYDEDDDESADEGGEQGDSDGNEKNDENFDRKSIDSAMDLSQGTPVKEEPAKITPEMAVNLKLQDEANDTPLLTNSWTARRKGRVLKLESKASSQSPEEHNDVNKSVLPAASSPISGKHTNHEEPNSSVDESMELTANSSTTNPMAANANANTSSSSNTSAASSSGNSSNSSNTSNNNSSNSNSNSSSTLNTSPPAVGAIYECKYCDIFFKDAVLYTIHMGYHSCDDVFKCNMCGEKCDGPVGLFVHMARNAHS